MSRTSPHPSSKHRLRLCAAAMLFAGLSAWRTGCVTAQGASGGIQAERGHTAAAGHGAVRSADEPALEAALRAYDSGNLAEARPALAALALRYPSNATVQAAAGMATVESGDIAAGVPFLERAHRLDPRNSGVGENLGIALLRLDQPAQALPLLQAASRLDPANATVRLGAAQALLSLRRYDEAAAGFQTALQYGASPGNVADLRHDWALALLNAGHPQGALAVLQGTPDADRGAPTEELLGETEEKLGHFQPAFGHFKQAAELDPSEANLLAYGNELLQHWTFPPAIEIFQFAHERFPASNRTYTGLGIAYFGNNDFAHAAEIFQAELAAQPGNATVADLLGRSCSAEGSVTAAACGGLVEFARIHPQNASANLYAAIALLHNASNPDDAVQAEALLRQSLAADPRRPEAWYQLAVLQQQRDQWLQSAASLEHAIALRPTYAEAHYRLSRAYGHTGRKDEAAQQIALQQQYAQAAKDASNRRMREVITFLTASN